LRVPARLKSVTAKADPNICTLGWEPVLGVVGHSDPAIADVDCGDALRTSLSHALPRATFSPDYQPGLVCGYLPDFKGDGAKRPKSPARTVVKTPINAAASIFASMR